MQPTPPAVAAKVPNAQLVHDDDPDCEAYWPAAQWMQAEAPTREKVPAPQAGGAERPALGQNVPAGQSAQEVAPPEGANIP